MSSHAVNAFGWDSSAFFSLQGTSCTTPPEIFFCDTDELSGFATLATVAVAKPYTLDRGNRVPFSVYLAVLDWQAKPAAQPAEEWTASPIQGRLSHDEEPLRAELS
jgi:hypothetical protein